MYIWPLRGKKVKKKTKNTNKQKKNYLLKKSMIETFCLQMILILNIKKDYIVGDFPPNRIFTKVCSKFSQV